MSGELRNVLFLEMSKQVFPVLKKEGIPLFLNGYEEIVWRCKEVIDNHAADVYLLVKECLAWSHYFSEIQHVILFVLEIKKEKLSYLQVRCTECEDASLVSSIRELEKDILLLQKYVKLLTSEKKYFSKMHHYCVEIRKRQK